MPPKSLPQGPSGGIFARAKGRELPIPLPPAPSPGDDQVVEPLQRKRKTHSGAVEKPTVGEGSSQGTQNSGGQELNVNTQPQYSVAFQRQFIVNDRALTIHDSAWNNGANALALGEGCLLPEDIKYVNQRTALQDFETFQRNNYQNQLIFFKNRAFIMKHDEEFRKQQAKYSKLASAFKDLKAKYAEQEKHIAEQDRVVEEIKTRHDKVTEDLQVKVALEEQKLDSETTRWLERINEWKIEAYDQGVRAAKHEGQLLLLNPSFDSNTDNAEIHKTAMELMAAKDAEDAAKDAQDVVPEESEPQPGDLSEFADSISLFPKAPGVADGDDVQGEA